MIAFVEILVPSGPTQDGGVSCPITPFSSPPAPPAYLSSEKTARGQWTVRGPSAGLAQGARQALLMTLLAVICG